MFAMLSVWYISIAASISDLSLVRDEGIPALQGRDCV